MKHLGLHMGEERLRNRVLPTVAHIPHRLGNPVGFALSLKFPPEFFGGVGCSYDVSTGEEPDFEALMLL